ncbi:MAG: RNA methyltransferase [Oscillospiraceae bacterium]|nr:RNA methyltransferase [Oscillospiraceae bacterium]
MEKITSRANTSISLMRRLMSDKKTRDEERRFIAEGDHLCKELASQDYKIELLAYTEKAALRYAETVEKLREKAARSIVITDELSEYISDTKSPQGIFAAAEKREDFLPENSRRIVVLDGIQDPGNVGTILRTAEALRTDGAVLVGACADIWSPKTLRASMGSAFRLPCIHCQAEELPEKLPGFTLYAAMLDKSAKPLGKEKFPEKTAVVIGSEGAGITPETANRCAEKIYIPIEKAESLNAAVAAAIILWELRS